MDLLAMVKPPSIELAVIEKVATYLVGLIRHSAEGKLTFRLIHSSSVPKLKERELVSGLRAPPRPPPARDFLSVHLRTKYAAREGHRRSLKGTSESPNTPLCAGGPKVPISPFGPYQGLFGSPKPRGDTATALAVPG